MLDPQPIVREVISHWYHYFDGLQQSPGEFYNLLERRLAARQIPDARFHRMEVSEGGIWTAKRLYLRVWRKNLVFDICGAPFGNSFFVSWWLCEVPSRWVATLSGIPVLNVLTWMLIRPITYYRVDTALMFQESVHQVVLEVMDHCTAQHGLRTLFPNERRPIMRDFLRPLR